MARAAAARSSQYTFQLARVGFRSILFLDETDLHGSPSIRLTFDRVQNAMRIASTAAGGGWEEHVEMHYVATPTKVSGAWVRPVRVCCLIRLACVLGCHPPQEIWAEYSLRIGGGTSCWSWIRSVTGVRGKSTRTRSM